MPAKAHARWQGDLRGGSGSFTAGDTGISGDFSYRTRFEDAPGANPEQLIGAAIAACFSMQLSAQLAEAGHPPDAVETDAVVTLRPLDGVPTIAKITLRTVGSVPGVDEATFRAQAASAERNCPVSRALRSVPEVTVDASLAS
jgi:osmotically inducible protein OsmC